MRKAKEITTFSPALALTERDRQRILFVLDRQMRALQRGMGRDLFAKLKEIRVYASSAEDPILAKHNLNGAATPDSVLLVYDLESGFMFSTHFDAWTETSAHELAHFAMTAFWEPHVDARVHGNNTVHYAYNTGEYLITENVTWWPTAKDAFLRRGEAMQIRHYDLPRLIGDTYRIKGLIKRGAAPIRQSHPYWQCST